MPRKLKIKLYMNVIRPVLLYGAECWTVKKKEEQILEKTEMRMLRRIKGVTLRDRVKSVDIRKELGVSSIQEKVREISLRWYGHIQRMEENEVRAVGDMRVPGIRQRGRPRGRWMASEGICRHYGSPRRMRRREHSGNQEFGPLTPPSWKRRRRRYFRMTDKSKVIQHIITSKNVVFRHQVLVSKPRSSFLADFTKWRIFESQ